MTYKSETITSRKYFFLSLLACLIRGEVLLCMSTLWQYPSTSRNDKIYKFVREEFHYIRHEKSKNRWTQHMLYSACKKNFTAHLLITLQSMRIIHSQIAIEWEAFVLGVLAKNGMSCLLLVWVVCAIFSSTIFFLFFFCYFV